MIGGVVVLGLFVVIELKVAEPLFRLSLFRLRAFTAGNFASLLIALGRGGLQFMLIMWLQGIWLPLHGYSFEETPLWAGIYMIPLTVGFLLSAPLSGYALRPLRGAGVHRRRGAAHRGGLRGADGAADGLQLLALRRAACSSTGWVPGCSPRRTGPRS